MVSKKQILFVIFLIAMSWEQCFAQVICTSNVGYKWKKGNEEPPKDELYALVEAQGVDEAASRIAIGPKLLRQKLEATDACRKKHEDMASCVTSKLAMNEVLLRTMTFTGRKSAEEAVSVDCKGQHGECKDAYASEPICQALVAQQSSSTGAESDKKEEKGKKKK